MAQVSHRRSKNFRIKALNQEPSLELHSRAPQRVKAHDCVNGLDTGRNSLGRRIIKKLRHLRYKMLSLGIKFNIGRNPKFAKINCEIVKHLKDAKENLNKINSKLLFDLQENLENGMFYYLLKLKTF